MPLMRGGEEERGWEKDDDTEDDSVLGQVDEEKKTKNTGVLL